ncbi:uncharacterized protein LOC110187319 [Drosophila serrata]|uniref:uncharacterized protein LOC110187319 n=1 Tax=Drosophila serrata TaxID=7274 RepID=UPI000A1CF995|nr:uncharacterized protein LOC110187319 [Drosophila serrata]
MFRLLTLKNNLTLQRNLVTRMSARSNIASGAVYRYAHRSRLIDGVVVVDINLDDMAKGDLEFARSFTKSISSLDSSLFQPAVGPVGQSENQLPSLEDAVPAVPADAPLPAGSPGTVMDKDGKPLSILRLTAGIRILRMRSQLQSKRTTTRI